MYSLLLMAALSQGSATPATFFNRGCYGGGCHGCYGGGYGCYGGGGWGCHGGLFSRWRGGCYGGGYGGCYGSGYGGCYGSGGSVYYRSGYGPGEGHGGHATPMPPDPRAGERVPAPGTTPPAATPPAKPPGDLPPPAASLGTRARLVVTLPADATLTIDGTETQSTAAQRVFVSPPLERGLEYKYALEAKGMRDGQEVSTRQEVLVRAGMETRVNLTLPTQATAQK